MYDTKEVWALNLPTAQERILMITRQFSQCPGTYADIPWLASTCLFSEKEIREAVAGLFQRGLVHMVETEKEAEIVRRSSTSAVPIVCLEAREKSVGR